MSGSPSIRDNGRRAEPWIVLALCAAVATSGAVAQLVHDRPTYAERSGPDWLPLAAAGLAALGIVLLLTGRPQLPRLHRALTWGGLLMLVWAAGGRPLGLAKRRRTCGGPYASWTIARMFMAVSRCSRAPAPHAGRAT